jgi:hypothetical protein
MCFLHIIQNVTLIVLRTVYDSRDILAYLFHLNCIIFSILDCFDVIPVALSGCNIFHKFLLLK